MSEYNQSELTQDVLVAFAGTPDARLRELMTALVKHVHAFAREVDLKPDEWLAGMKFLNAVGQISTEGNPARSNRWASQSALRDTSSACSGSALMLAIRSQSLSSATNSSRRSAT